MERRRPSNIAAVILAAGRSTRFGGGATKLVAKLDGRALARRVAEAAVASRAAPTIVVTGHQREAVEAELFGLPVVFAHNPDYAEGLSASLRTGLAAAPEADGAVILLADMPLVGPGLIDALIAAFEKEAAAAPPPVAAAPFVGERRGNPVLVSRALFPALAALRGDQGARALLDAAGGRLLRVAAQDEAALVDVDASSDLFELADAAARRRRL